MFFFFFFFFGIRRLFTTAQATSDVDTMGYYLIKYGASYTCGWVHRGTDMGVQEVHQHLALDLKAIRGDLVEAGGGREGSWNREGRLQETLHL